MTLSPRRNRIVSVRISQVEYEQLERISRDRGAHSVSDFVRWVLTGWGLGPARNESSMSGIAARVADLQKQVDLLSYHVSEIRRTTAEGARQQNGG